MRRIILFSLIISLVIFLTGCGSGGGKTNCCPASVYTTDDAIARELLGWPSGWEEVCEQVRASNNVFGGRFYVKGLCFAPDADYPGRYYTGGSGFFGPTCEQCVRGGEEAGERRIWVPCDEKAVPCRPELKKPKEREIPRPAIPSYCYPWGEPVERCGFFERFFGDCPRSYKTCYRFPDWDAPLEDDEGRRYLWACRYPGSLRPPDNEGCGSDAPENCNWPPPGSPGGYYWDRPFHIVTDPFCETLIENLE